MTPPTAASAPRPAILCGDCREILPSLDPVAAVVTDPPYGLEFMGQGWDRGVPGVDFWKVISDAMLPGAHLLAFGGTRTFHRLTCAIEDAGFEIRDCLMWVYGSGFPKSLDVSKAIDKAVGAEREAVGVSQTATGKSQRQGTFIASPNATDGIPLLLTAPATEQAKQWEGWGTALKPAWEPIILARKPLVGTVAENVQQYGTGALNIDGCRVGTTDSLGGGAYSNGRKPRAMAPGGAPRRAETGSFTQPDLGRWPANLIHDGSDEVLALFPETDPSKRWKSLGFSDDSPVYGKGDPDFDTARGYEDVGGSAARFFYCAKAATNERSILLSCNCETVKLSAWVNEGRKQNEQMGGPSRGLGTSEKGSQGDLFSNTFSIGNVREVLSPRVPVSTIETETSRTTDSEISNSSPIKTTRESTADANCGGAYGGSRAPSVRSSSPSTKNTGTSRPKGGRSTGVVVPATLAALCNGNVCDECGAVVKVEGHPTQKPVELMRYLCRLVTPPGGTILDPFAGSGSTLIAARAEGFRSIGIELEKRYCEMAERRIQNP